MPKPTPPQRERVARALREMLDLHRRMIVGQSADRSFGQAIYDVADAIIDLGVPEAEVTVQPQRWVDRLITAMEDDERFALLASAWRKAADAVQEASARQGEARAEHARPMTGEDAEWFGQHVYVDEPTRTWPEGSECPIHKRVHDSHGWYVCLPVVRPEQAEAITKIERLLFEQGVGGGKTHEIVQRLVVENRQYREAHSHAQQLRDHYSLALHALLEAVTDDPLHGDYLHHVDKHAVTAARTALARPPEWDMKLRA